MRNVKISTRLYCLVGFTLAVLAATMVFFLNYSYSELEAERKAGLAQMDATALGIFDKYYKMEQAGTMTREQAQAAAKDVIGAMRYGADGYFWINDMRPTMVMHPIKPQLNGTDISQMKDPTGKFLFVEFVNKVKKDGKGFVDYLWPKPGADEPVLKYSYVAGFEPWGWIVGTGVYADDLAALYRQNAIWAALLCLLGAAATIAIAYAIVRSVTAPIARLKAAMNAIAAEEASVEIAGSDRRDEIGQMAKVLLVLRDSVDERSALRGREDERQRQTEEERRGNEASLRSVSERQTQAMQALGVGLEKLAGGDLTVAIGDIGEDYAKLRGDFNAAVDALNGVIHAIAESSHVVNESASDISEATGNLSKRTEQQAAALEETAAALDEITATVKTASERANEAREMVTETKASAGKSGEIVRNAVTAMGRIEESSNRISQIISVIDEIAFQTNLLALNAGVEAARAGEAGRGFAVVAQEVRELAQRSANAAKEIKALISRSAAEVEGGVALVRSTGDALLEIEALVNRVNDHVVSIATAAREQSTGLNEINSSVNHMDQMTQQNAAMVEETTAASRTLADESTRLKTLLANFRLRGAGQQAEARYTRAA
ncbi:methyl-accepting chemotaxis protein [Rhizobium ruizarguesonis]|uniref:HAMP domain-containing protein n=1 Tax=Rhizobium ruizarguesonis TaxID=2081791 RepID=A0AB38I072_9HYPH|nr:methyl-accepting chemotaxis protein [Rhizobium ruizarguesonis]NEI05146.1 HAMP domain-containing protein [Rhizobium ruizarguesonis]NEI28422.1 HAMP domain-containing protein [Rhizobium ruizarguesonis]TAZ78929.1 HAMP domain-containing protein [Rhizobium ruizarguesonis]TBA05304.1 HAMP domain-containing protein [Rhizobium ruizarguesonis]TBA26737.1 HAMP domain-containing protein [Rhizobium ruizarguesonis]